MPKANNLAISVPIAHHSNAASRSGLTSPRTPLTPRSPPPSSTIVEGKPLHFGDGYDSHVNSPINALPPPPSAQSPKQNGGSVTAKIFGNKYASKSVTRLASSSKNNLHESSPSRSPGNAHANGSSVYLNSGAVGGYNPSGGALSGAVNKSTPDVSVSHPHSGQSSPDRSGDFRPDTLQSSSTLPTNSDKEKSRRTQHKFGNFLNRKSSLHGDENAIPPSPTEPLPPQSSSSNKTTRDGRAKPDPIKANISHTLDGPVRTAPLEKERGFRSAMNSALRNRSLDRADEIASERTSQAQHAHKPSSLGPNGMMTQSTNPHSSVMSNLRSGGSKAAEGINKARKGLFSKLNRSGSSHEREVRSNEPYEFQILYKPLEEQARITRIAKRLHYCKDKTEFWLPAFPYRCIDYLSDRGTYSEGLYRVPGSELEIKHYMKRFDTEHDIDLFDCPDLHDVNVVATMLKRWLSNLPPVLPLNIQSDIIDKCADEHPTVEGSTTPTFMKEALSNLPPWNYYLLFAITGHISFLHNHREQNKMTYENLFRCFATRALQVEPYIFHWLVWDWRGCWAGCNTEDEYKVKEYEVLDKIAAEQEEAKRGVQKKDSKEAVQEKRKTARVPISGLSKQSVSGREKIRPQTSHAHSQSMVSVASKGQVPALPLRPRSPEKSTIKSVNSERSQERGRERERERQQDQDRAISSSDSSKPSITGQSSAGVTDEDRASQEKEKPGDARANGEEKVKGMRMELPMLSPMKPLSPFGLH